MRCVLCQAEGLSEMFATKDRKRWHDPTRYAVLWCRDCALGRVDLQSRSNADFFNIPYYTHGDGLASMEGRPMMARIAWRFDYGRDLTPADFANASTLCDIGCGDGSHLKRFAEAGFKVVGIEPDAVAREFAGIFGDVFDGTAEALPPSVLSSRFDVVLMSHVLDACMDPHAALRSAVSILADDGTLVIEVPNCASLGFRTYGANWPWVDVPRHLTFFTEASLRRLLEAAGLRTNGVYYLGYTRQFKFGADGWWLARTAIAPAKAKYDTVRIHATRSRGALR